MTLDDALTEARRRVGTDTLAVWVRNTLGEAMPCGFEPARVSVASRETVIIPEQYSRGSLSPNEARAFAASILRAADECYEANER